MKTGGSLLCSQKLATGSVLSDMNLFQTGNRKKGTTLQSPYVTVQNIFGSLN